MSVIFIKGCIALIFIQCSYAEKYVAPEQKLLAKSKNSAAVFSPEDKTGEYLRFSEISIENVSSQFDGQFHVKRPKELLLTKGEYCPYPNSFARTFFDKYDKELFVVCVFRNPQTKKLIPQNVNHIKRTSVRARAPQHGDDPQAVSYQNGHLAPSADYDEANRDLSFSYWNYAPQWGSLNNGAWSQVENDIRRLPITNLRIYTGIYPIREEEYQVPRWFWKFYNVQNLSGTTIQAVFYISYNDPSKSPGVISFGLSKLTTYLQTFLTKKQNPRSTCSYGISPLDSGKPKTNFYIKCTLTVNPVNPSLPVLKLNTNMMHEIIAEIESYFKKTLGFVM